MPAETGMKTAECGPNSLLTGVAGVYGEGVCFGFLESVGMGWGDGEVRPH